jgi:DNA gyrase subunit A
MPSTPSGENIRRLRIQDEMKDSYLRYAMSVIVSRALPDVRDGLKPSQRRILVAMHDLNLSPRSKHRKCAKIAGDASGNYHPHGEGVVYPTLVRMGQDFTMRAPLVDPQGNFGSIDGDPPAAMRYTEARLAGPASELLEDLEKETVDFVPNYDDRLKEPTVLPGKFPNLIVNGASGIAVGMASSIPPHNLREVIAGLTALIRKPDLELRELIEILPGPDFPTGGLICGRAGIFEAYATGRGLLHCRGRVEVEDRAKDRQALIITEIPYNLNKVRLIESMAGCVHSGRIDGISSINDESDRQGMRIVVDLKRGEDPRVVLNNLYQHTPLQDTFSVNMIALVDGRPRTLGILDLMREYVRHRMEVVRRRTQFLLAKAEARAHILEGLLKALDHIDEVIETIRSSADIPSARAALMSRFDLSEIQADAILEMRLSRLTALERGKLEEELAGLRVEIADYRAILADEGRVRTIIVDELAELSARFGDPRRTEITEEVEEFIREDLIAEEQMVVTLTHSGYVKRLPLSTYRTQARGGRGITGADLKEGDDFIEQLFVASTHDMVLFFTDRGKVYWSKVYQLPEAGRVSRGRALVNVLELDPGETVTSVIPVSGFEGESYIFMATAKGIVKKTPLEAYSRPQKGGIKALVLDEGDELIGVRLTTGRQEIILGTAMGKAIRFNEEDARPMGRVAHGVRGIRLAGDDRVVDLAIVREGADILTACERGYGKRTTVSDYRLQSRGGQGTINIRATPRNGPVVAVKDVSDDDDLMLMSEDGMVVRIRVSSISVIGRATQGVRLIRLREGDRLVSAAKVPPSEDEDLDSLTVEEHTATFGSGDEE